MKARLSVGSALLGAAMMFAGPGDAAAQTHNGYVDSISCVPAGCSIVGWVCRIWYPQYTYTDTLEIYEDGPYGTGTQVYSNNPVLAGYRPDTASYCGNQNYNGFSAVYFWSNPAPYRQYYVYIRDNQSGARQLLSPSPITPTY